MEIVDSLLRIKPFSLKQEKKEKYLDEALLELTNRHLDRCLIYKNIYKKLENVYPLNRNRHFFLPVSLFKEFDLKSIPDEKVVKVLTSSGTSGQRVSKIYLDAQTANLQAEVLRSIMAEALGEQRLPMLIFDNKSVLKNRLEFSARGAGILGMSIFGKNHTYALGDDLKVDYEVVEHFLNKHKNERKFLFGFTFLIWQSLFGLEISKGLDFSNSILVHGGGWKKLIEKSVTNEIFKKNLSEHYNIDKVYSYYGMVEQVGSVFLEGDDGYLYAPAFADVIIRDPFTLEELPDGEIGVIQVLSMLPRSYPGHSLLTEDLGVIHYRDQGIGGRYGKAFSVLGRIPSAELRGCSDVIAKQQEDWP